MKIYIDADACPVTGIVERVAKEYAIPVVLLCDTNHVLSSDYSEIRVIGAGADAVDIALINLCQRGDIVVTQDYGVAALALGKGAKAIHQSGRWYTDENIESLLMERHMAKVARRSSTLTRHSESQRFVRQNRYIRQRTTVKSTTFPPRTEVQAAATVRIILFSYLPLTRLPQSFPRKTAT